MMSENQDKPTAKPTGDEPGIHPDQRSMKQYWIFFSGQLFSLFGSSVVQFAIIWWLTVTSAARYPGQTGFILSLAFVAGFAPFVVTSLFAGVLVDRWNRKLVIGAADAMQAAVTGILLVLFILDMAAIPTVLVILGARAVAQGFHSPATQAIIPLMVPKEKFTQVNSYQYLFNGLVNLVGPVIGALLVEFVGVDNIGTILWLDVISFGTAVIPLILIHIPDITKEKRENAEDASFKKEFREGTSFITASKGLLPLLLTFTIINILISPVFMLLPLIVISPDILNAGATSLSLIMAASQGGSILASYILTRKEIFGKNVRGVASGQFFIYTGVFIMAFGAMLGSVWIMMIGSFINGVAMPVANIHSQNIWQSVVPPELQGRVMAVRQTIAWILIPPSQLLGGYLADTIGPVNLYFAVTVVGMIILTVAWFMTGLSRVEQDLGIDPEFQDNTPDGGKMGGETPGTVPSK